MRERTVTSSAEHSRLLDTKELRAYVSLGHNGSVKLGEDSGAKIRIGRRVLWDKNKIDKYLDSLTEV